MDFDKPNMRSMTMVPVPVKKQRIGEPTSKFNEIATFRHPKQQIIPTGEAGSIPRTSSLQAPNMLLAGHEGEVYTAKFINPDGGLIASAGFDRRIFIWSTYGECDNIAVLQGHGGAILDLQTSTDGEYMFTTSSDKTIGVWDIEHGTRIKRIKGHNNIVNCVTIARRGPQIICSGSDDNTMKLWDSRYKKEVHSFDNNYQVLACTFNDTSEVVYTGGIDNVIKAWDLRRLDISLRLSGHTDTVTGLTLSPDGNFLLSNSMDQTLKVWDIRPFVQGDRCSQTFQGHTHTFEKNLLRCSWSPDGRKVSCGSGDKFVYIWDRVTKKLLYKLPGHAASVNETAFHQYEPIIMSAGSDKKIFVGEINLF